MGVIKKIKIFLGIFIPFLAIFVMSQNTFALWTADYGVRYYDWSNNQCSNETYDENHSYNALFYGCQVSAVVPISQEISANGDTVVYSGKLNLVKRINPQKTNQFYQNLHLAVRSIYFGNYQLNLSQNPSIQYYITDWSSNNNYYQTLTIKWSIVAHNNSINNTTGRMRVTLYADNNSGRFDAAGSLNNSGSYYFENTNEPLTLYFIDTGGQANDTIINQNNISISQNEQIINQNQTFYDNEYQGEQNISNQTTDDIDGATNQQTTTLLDVLTGFISAITNISAASNCRISLAFPDFAGGTQIADLCQGKNSSLVNIASSVTMVMVFVPLAWILLKMIYNEIRSWTNG